MLKAALPARIAAVISNRADAAGLAIAAQHGVPTRVVEHRQFASRDAFDAKLAEVIDEYAPDYVLLAGFMRILGEAFVSRYPGRLVNIHPSLLPAFPGRAHARARTRRRRQGAWLHRAPRHAAARSWSHHRPGGSAGARGRYGGRARRTRARAGAPDLPAGRALAVRGARIGGCGGSGRGARASHPARARSSCPRSRRERSIASGMKPLLPAMSDPRSARRTGGTSVPDAGSRSHSRFRSRCISRSQAASGRPRPLPSVCNRSRPRWSRRRKSHRRHPRRSNPAPHPRRRPVAPPRRTLKPAPTPAPIVRRSGSRLRPSIQSAATPIEAGPATATASAGATESAPSRRGTKRRSRRQRLRSRRCARSVRSPRRARSSSSSTTARIDSWSVAASSPGRSPTGAIASPRAARRSGSPRSSTRSA